MAELTRDPLLRAFGKLVRRHREARELTRQQVADQMSYSFQWLEKLERGDRAPSAKAAEDLDRFFETGRVPVFSNLFEDIKAAGKHVELPPGFGGFVALEAEAVVMSIFENMVITGLFQTEEYARALLRKGRKPDAIERAIETRLERQQILDRDDAPDIVLIVDEGALRRVVGDADIMRAQVEHLVKIAELPNVELQIVPLKVGAHPGVMGAFTILEFDDDKPNMVYVEGHAGGQVIDAHDRVRTHALRFSQIRGEAATASDSRTLLHTIMENL